MKVGVLAMQGAYMEHINFLQQLNIDCFPLRYKEELNEIDGLIIPGGESTSIGKLLDNFELTQTLQEKIEDGLPVWGTCAGMILLAKEIINCDITHIPVIDIKVVRNAYGRQLSSFSIRNSFEGIEGEDFPMVFIRAPYIEKVGKGVSILGEIDNKIIAARKDNILVTSFHPELSDDLRIHQYFIDMISNFIM